MIDDAIAAIPLRYRFNILYAILGFAALALVALAAYLGTSNVIQQTRTVHDKPSYGNHVQTISGTQIGLQAGVCDVYQQTSKLILVCHQ